MAVKLPKVLRGQIARIPSLKTTPRETEGDKCPPLGTWKSWVGLLWVHECWDLNIQGCCFIQQPSPQCLLCFPLPRWQCSQGLTLPAPGIPKGRVWTAPGSGVMGGAA